MYLDENLVTVGNMKGRALAEAYINEYSNSFLVDPSVASKEYRRYMTRSLIDRGFLYKNSKTIEFLRKAPLESLFNQKFRELFLYQKDRIIKGLYNEVSDIKRMGIVGNFDLLSSINTCITAKLLPLYEGLAISDGDYSEILNEINLPEIPPSIVDDTSDPEEDLDIPEISENGIIENTDPVESEETTSDVEITDDPIVNDNEEPEIKDVPHAILSEEEIEEVNKKIITDQKIKHIVDSLNNEFFDSLKYFLSAISYYIKNHDLYEIFDAFRSDDKHHRENINNLYRQICEIFHYLYIAVDLEELINTYTTDEEKLVLYPLEIVKHFVENNMSKLNIVSDTMGIKRYFTPKVLNSSLFSKEFLNKYSNYELRISHPVIDLIETGELNFPIEQVVFMFTDNLNKFKSLCIKEMNNSDGIEINKENYKDIFGIFVYTTNIFFQMFSMSSYLSKNRQQIHTNIHNNIMKSCEEIDYIYDSKYSKEFILYHVNGFQVT